MSARDGRMHREELAERLRHYASSTALSTSDLLSGGVVALAAGVGLEIVAGGADRPLKALFWIAGLSFFVVLHAFWRLGALFASWGSGVGDLIAPLALGLLEFSGFIVLSRGFSLTEWWVVWPFLVAGQALAASAFVHNRLVQAAVPGQYAADCDDFIAQYVSWMRQGRAISAIAAGVLALFAAAVAATQALGLSGWSRGLATATAVQALVFGGFSLASSASSQRRFQKSLFGEPAPPAAGPPASA